MILYKENNVKLFWCNFQYFPRFLNNHRKREVSQLCKFLCRKEKAPRAKVRQFKGNISRDWSCICQKEQQRVVGGRGCAALKARLLQTRAREAIASQVEVKPGLLRTFARNNILTTGSGLNMTRKRNSRPETERERDREQNERLLLGVTEWEA